ncbi:MAG: winged helix-turn-helix domain-containing protein [Methanothrix sp.]|jgi:hypothetical protein
MTKMTVESIFGMKAGVVWRALNQNGPSNIGDLVEITSMSREEVNGALGWLGREGKIIVERRGRAMVFSLHEAEARLEASKGTTIGDSVPQEQTPHKSSKPPKKITKARKVKVGKDKALFKQSEKTDEFLLH